MTPEAYTEIEKRGAEARAHGLQEVDCPFFKVDSMPAKTGEELSDWLAKVRAWMIGWKLEDAIRSQHGT